VWAASQFQLRFKKYQNFRLPPTRVEEGGGRFKARFALRTCLVPPRFPAEMSRLQQSPTPRLETLYMTKKFMCLIAIVSAGGAVMLFAQEGTTKAAEGTLMLEKKTYPLKHALAYEATIDNE
jgi:hypothetical protein